MTRGRLLALMALHVALAAGTSILSKLATDGFPSSEGLTLARALGSAVLLLALTGTVIPKPDFDGPTWLKLFLLGVLLVPVNQYLFLAGLKASVPGHSALLYALTPLGVLLLMSALDRRAPSGRTLLGVSVALSGALVVLAPWPRGAEAASVRHGGHRRLLAVVAWVIYTVSIRGLCRRHEPRTVTAWTLILGAIATMPIGAASLKSTDWSAIPPSAWWGLVWMIVITSVTMMLLWSALLRHLEPVQVAICMNAQPPATALLQVLLGAAGVVRFSVSLGVPFFAGMALVLLGVAIVQRLGSRSTPAAVPATPALPPD